MAFYLGIDAGGTTTSGALADDHQELVRAQAGTIKLLRTGEDAARENFASLVSQLTRAAKIDPREIACTCIGISGYSVPLVANWIRRTLPQFAGGELLLCGDEEIALDAAFFGGPGVLVVAGTGSNIIGRASDGTIVHAGGWGPALADEGSGHWIGHQSLRSGFRALDEDLPTELLTRVSEHWQLPGLEELIERANATPPPNFAELVPIVVECADRGDVVAGRMLHRAGEELANQVLHVIRKLRAAGESALPSVAFIGSVLKHIGKVREAMTHTLVRSYPEIRVFTEPVDAIQGALWRARRTYGP